MLGCRLLIRSVAGAKQNLSKLRPFSTTSSACAAATPKRRLPEFAMFGLCSVLAGVDGGVGYAAYANRVDATSEFKLDKKDLEADEALWILYKKRSNQAAPGPAVETEEKRSSFFSFKRWSGHHEIEKTNPTTRPTTEMNKTQGHGDDASEVKWTVQDEMIALGLILVLVFLFFLFVIVVCHQEDKKRKIS